MIIPLHRFPLLSFFQLIILSTQVNHIHGTVEQNPPFACLGQGITVNCALSPPTASDTFTLTAICAKKEDPVEQPCFIIKDGSVSLSANSANGCGNHAGFDLCQVNASALGGNSTAISGFIYLKSFSHKDNNLLMGCLVRYAVDGNEAKLMNWNETIRLVQAAPPSTPSLQNSINNFNPSTCSAGIALTWMTPPSNRTVDMYFLYLDGSPLATTTSNSYNHSTILNTNTDYQFSLTASSCAGNSNNSQISNLSVSTYTFTKNNPLFTCLAYNNDTGQLTINWELDSPSQPAGVSGIKIEYSFRVTYSHSNGIVTYLFTNSTFAFNLVSNITTYNVALVPDNFTNPQGVETNVSAYVRILQQCGQSVGAQKIHCSLSTVTPFPVTILTSTHKNTSSTHPTHSPTALNQNIIFIGSITGGVFVVVVLLVLFCIILGMCVCFLKRKRRDSSFREPLLSIRKQLVNLK